MPTVQQLLSDIDLRYRNSFTPEQKIVWMNEEQEELFQTFEIDSAPYAFELVPDNYFYPIPDGVDIDRIKVMTVQINDQDPPVFEEIHFKRNDDDVSAWHVSYWYTIVENNFYINLPSASSYVEGRFVYIYCDTEPERISVANLNVEPSTPLRYQEILKLGTLERIAAARKDVQMKNAFYADKQEKILEFEWKMKMSEPEFIQPTNPMPVRHWRRTRRFYPYWE